jgi:hypothetical protein
MAGKPEENLDTNQAYFVEFVVSRFEVFKRDMLEQN